jgi:hypothetical protein
MIRAITSNNNDEDSVNRRSCIYSCNCKSNNFFPRLPVPFAFPQRFQKFCSLHYYRRNIVLILRIGISTHSYCLLDLAGPVLLFASHLHRNVIHHASSPIVSIKDRGRYGAKEHVRYRPVAPLGKLEGRFDIFSSI